MKRLNMKCLCAAILVSLGLSTFAAISRTTVKTVTWTLPSDWEGTVELDQICEPVGAPSVPYYNALIEVPSTATNFTITASGVAYRASDRARPTPVLEPSVVGEPANAPVEDAALYAGIYPSDVFEQGEPWEMNGKTYLPVRVKVYRWNGPAAKTEALQSLSLSIACTSPRTGLKLTTSAVPTEKVDYIVISPHNYVDYWKPFIEYRQTTHANMTFQIVDANDIYSKYTSGDHQLKIHHFIEDMYKLGTRYILLGAGAPHSGYNSSTMIPIRSVVSYNGNMQSCDFYYCVLDYMGGKEVWDYNGDGIYLASKNSSGGYTTDSTSQFTWQGKMMVHRFPARDTVTLGGKSKTAQQQIEGYVEKLKRAEQGLFGGRFSQAILGHQRSASSDTAHGNTSSDATMERQFYDLGANIFSEEHGKSITGIELDTRARAYNYMTVKRPVGYNRSVLQFYYKNDETASTFYGRNFDAMLINAHGSPETVEPITYGGVFTSTGLCVFHIMCCPCHAGNPCSGGNTEVSIAEAGVVNPDGGSLVTYANSASGWYGGRDVMSQKIEVNLVRQLYGITDGEFKDAGTARLYAQNNYGYSPSPRNANGQCLINGMAYGDPLVKLSDIYSRVVSTDGVWHRGDLLDTPSDQEFASTLTINATNGDMTVTFTNAVGAANLTVNGTAGKTLTLNATGNGKFKVSNTVTVKNGMTLNWDVPGGFGRNGVNMANGGNLRLRADGYYGIDFKGIGTMTVAPPAEKTAIVDFDSKNYFRDNYLTAIEVTGPGETIFRSRQAGIFSEKFSIPVKGGTLILETPCVGGSGKQTSTTPLFKVSNGATLKVRPNPNWSAECFSRRVTFEGGNLNSAYDKFYLGTNGSGYPGLDVTVNGTNNVFAGIYPIRLNGQLRIHTESNGVLNATAEFANGGGTGSIAVDAGVTLILAKANSFSGGVTVAGGSRVIVDNARGLGGGDVVVQSNAVLQINEMPLVGVKSVTLQSGAKLVLKSSSGASYQMYNPSTTSFTMADGVKVYDSKDETKELDGIVTPEGAYFISDAAKVWANISGKSWKNDSTVLAWNKKGESGPIAYADGDTVLFKNTNGVAKVTVAVEGDVAPGMMAFQNTETPYEFTGSGTITVGSMATAGTTTFTPSIKATSQVSVGGKTALSNVTTPTLNVAGGGVLNVSGTVKGIDTIGSMRFTASATGLPNWADKFSALQLSELQFFDENGALIIFPVDTVIKDSVGNSVTITAVSGSTYTFSGTSTLKNLFDGNCSTYHTVGNSKTGPWSITINLGAPVVMFKTFKYGRGESRYVSDQWARVMTGYNYYPYGNPYGWYVDAGSSESSLSRVITTGASYDGNSSSLSGAYTASQTATSSSKATVQNGGTIVLNGTYNMPVTINSGATLAVTNDSKLTFGSTKSIPSGTYSMTVDATQAKKSSTYFQVTSGGGFSSVWQVLTADDVAAKIDGNNLWIATEGVMAPPYSRTISESGSWNTADWYDGKTNKFDAVWGSKITKQTGTGTLNVTGTNLTLNVDCGVYLDTLAVVTPTNCFPQTLTVTGSDALGISAIDFRGFNGKVTWNPALASWGSNIYVGTNDVTIASMTVGTGKLQVGEGGRATVPEKFASYDVDQNAYVRFTGTHNFAMSDIPTKGYLSFKNTTLTGAFQNSLITYIVEDGDTLTFTGTSDNYNGRISSSFDIRGGTVTINSNGASTWFGINGDTTYNQTGGVFKCTANGTGTSGTGNGLLIGYSASKTEDFEFNISGGRFEVPSSTINFFGPARFSLVTNGVVQAKGVMKSGSNKGTITVNAGTVFEIGSIGLIDGACDFNLYGGTLAGFENGAQTLSAINLAGYGTLAAKAGTTLDVNGAINADDATLNFGTADYTGTVKLADIPTGVTNITVTAGTWDMGEYRPTNDVPVSVLNGKIAALLDEDELREAAQGGFKLIKTTLDTAAVQSHVAVSSASGATISANGLVKDGYIYVKIDYVYPLKAVAEEDVEWENLDWHDSIGLQFADSWGKVSAAVLSNTLDSIVLAIPAAYTGTVTTVNSGTLTLTNNVTLPKVDDSASTGKTTIGFTANNVVAGAETVIKYAGTGTLTLANGKCAALWNNLTWGGTISGFSGTAKIKYVGDGTLTSAPYNTSGGGYVSYAQKMAMDNLAFENSLTRFFEDGADITVTRFVTGNQKNTSGQTFYQTGGRIEATGTGSVGDSTATSTSPILFSHWPNNVTYYLTGGELIATNGADGSVYFGRDGVPKLYIGGGEKKATMRVNGFVNDGRSGGSKSGSLVELKPNGYLEIGKYGFLLNQSAELRMSGGTFLAYESAEIKSATSSFTLTANTTSYLVATNGATLTVSKIPTGTGALVCQADDGTVLLSGDYSNVTLGGKFTLKMTAAQSSSVVDVALFKVADADNLQVTVQKNDGTESKGAYRVVDGVFRWNASGNYALPLKATVTQGGAWKDLDWYDSSATPQKVSDTFWASSTSATVCELTVNQDATIEEGAVVAAGTVALSGPGILTIPTNLTITALTGNATVIADGYSPTWGGLTATTWAGCVKLTGIFPAGKDIGALGNANSTIEFAGTNAEPTAGYFATPVEVNAPFVLSGTMKISNGNSNSIQVKFNKKFSGTGTFLTVDNSKPGNPDIFQVLGDASEFAGTVTLVGAAHSITFGAHNYGYGGYIYVTANNGATIAADKTWTAANAINVDANGLLNIAHRSNVATPSTVNVAAGGYINLLQASSVQTVWPITSGTLNMNGGVMVNGVTIGKDRYTVANGTITLGSNAVGATVSINVGGGAASKAGKLISNGNYAGVIPVLGKNWNQDALQTTTTKRDVTISNLKEVLSDGSVITGPMKVRLLAKNTYSAVDSSTSPNGDGELMLGYLDDGSGSGTGKGAGVYVDNIPYTTYDVYVYMGTDQTSTSGSFGVVTATAGGKTSTYPSSGTSWGNASSTHNTVTLGEGTNYVKFTGMSGSSLTVLGAIGAQPIRCGIAGIQIFNTGTRLNELTWKGAASGGTWDKTTANWTTAVSSSTTWSEISDGFNIAKFTSDTTLTLGEMVCPDVLNMTYNGTVTYEGYIPKGKDNAVLVASNEELSKVTAVAGVMSGGWITEGSATAYYPKRTDSQYSVQFQKLNNQLKCAKVVMFQDGSDIKAYIEYSGYVTSGTEGSVDFDSTSYESANTPMDSTSAGYGVKNLALTIARGGVLTVASAENFGKSFIVTNGTLCVAANTLTQSVTLAPGAYLNIISTAITNEYLVTTGDVVGGSVQNILFNGEAIDTDTWNIDELENGKLKRIVKPGTTPFTFTITQNGETQWTNAPWVASNWFYVRPEEWTTNTVAEAKLTVDGGVTNTLVANATMAISNLVVNNSGVLTITNGQVKVKGEGEQWKDFSLDVTILDDSSSNGTTILGIAPTNVTAGIDTIIGSSILGKLTVNGGGKATINGKAASYDIKSGGEVRYIGDTEITDAFDTTEGAIFAYKRATLAMAADQYWTLKTYDGDFVTATGSGYINPILVTGGELVLTNLSSQSVILYGGKNVSNKSHSNITVTGGKVTVLASGTGTENTNCGFLFGTTAHGDVVPSLTIDGGEFDVSGGHFTFWQKSAVAIANGLLKAKGIYKQDGNESSLTVSQGGIVEVGCDGIAKDSSQTLNVTFNGGTLRATDDAEEKLPIAMTGINTFSAANNKKLTISGLLSGEGSVVIGEADYTGTVKFTVTNSFTGGVSVQYGTLEAPVGSLKGDIAISSGAKLNLIGTASQTEYAITDGAILFGAGASITNNITVNGVALKADDKWELEGGTIKRRIITPPFTFYITQNANWDELEWRDSTGLVLRDYEVAYYKTQKPAITLNVQNESSLFITNVLDLASLAITGSKLTLDFGQYDAAALAAQAKFLKPSTNVLIKTTSAISGTYATTQPSLPTDYKGDFLSTTTGLAYVVTAPRQGYDYVGTVYYPEDYYAPFESIVWENGVTFTNDYQNTVTLKVAGDIDLYVTKPLDLYKFSFEQYDSEDPAYVYLCAAGDFADTFAKVRTFDFSGATIVDSKIDFGSRIEAMPIQSFQLESAYTGPLKEKYAFCADGNAIIGSAFDGTYARLFGSGTLSGDFSITQGGTVMIYGAYDGSGATFDVGAGTLQVYTNITLKAVTNSVMAGNLVIDYNGSLTANLDGFGGSITVGAGYYGNTDALHMTGTAKGNITINPYGSLYLSGPSSQLNYCITTGAFDFTKGTSNLYVNDKLIDADKFDIENGTIKLKTDKKRGLRVIFQ